MTDDATDTIATESGIAVLADATDDFDADAPWKVNGVAITEGAITRGQSEVERFWPADTLRDAAELLEGKPIVKNFHEMEGQAPADDVIGEVTKTGYADGVGLVYEGEITDEAIANKIAAGYLDVSPVMALVDGPMDEQAGVRRVERVEAFRDLAVVAEGAVPGNEIELGPNPAVAALSAEALSQAMGGESTDTETMPAESGEDADSASGAGDDGPSELEAADGGEGQSNPDAESDCESDVERGVTRGLQERDAEEDTTTMSEYTDKEKELLARAQAMDDPEVVEADALRRFNENVELINAAEEHDEPTVVDETEYESLQENVETIEEVLGNVLVETKGLKEATVEAMGLEAMAAEVGDDLDVEVLSQEPETGDVSGTESEGAETESLGDVDAETKSEAADILRRADLMKDRTPDHADALRQEAAELLGAEDVEALESAVELRTRETDSGVEATLEVL